MMTRLYSGIWILPSKKRCQVGPPLATLSGSVHGLYIMCQSFVTTASPQPLSRTGISIAWYMCCVFTVSLSPQCGGNVVV